ncbi:hypothetical protein Ga0061062_10987 [Comamonas thiooxydans]|nr:hypothetical protein Ga0061062_10987 [Comamonas thiooxydans]
MTDKAAPTRSSISNTPIPEWPAWLDYARRPGTDRNIQRFKCYLNKSILRLSFIDHNHKTFEIRMQSGASSF